MTHTHTPTAITDVEEGMLLRVEFDQQIHLHAIEGPVGYQGLDRLRIFGCAPYLRPYGLF